jgi:hypothetical protein
VCQRTKTSKERREKLRQIVSVTNKTVKISNYLAHDFFSHYIVIIHFSRYIFIYLSIFLYVTKSLHFLIAICSKSEKEKAFVHANFK